MIDHFTEEYRQIMLDAENRARQFGYKEILPEDILLQAAKIPQGNVSDIFATYGINESLLLELFARPPFALESGGRLGNYTGISERLRAIIVLSLRIAANFGKKQASVEDFLIALLESPEETWFAGMLDFIGITPKDVHQELIELNRMISGAIKPDGASTSGSGGMFGPIDDIMNMIEEHFGKPQNIHSDSSESSPFSQNPPQDKKESATPALDFFGTDLTLEAKNKKIDPIIGRDTEIDRLISILNRKTKNNPVLVGDP